MQTITVLRVKRTRADESVDALVLDVGARVAKASRVDVNELPLSALSVSDASSQLPAAAAPDAAAPSRAPAAVKFRRIARGEEAAAIGPRALSVSVMRGLRALHRLPRARPAAELLAAQVFARQSVERGRVAAANRLGGGSGSGGGGGNIFFSEGDNSDEDTPGARIAVGGPAAAVGGGRTDGGIEGTAGEADISEPVRVRIFDIETAVGGDGVTLRRRWLGARDAASVQERVTFLPARAPVLNRVMTPLERAMDEAIWRGFRSADLRGIAPALAMGASINYQRAASDLTTPLMAAAFCGDSTVVGSLVRRGALVRVTDSSGRTAVSYAASAGHVSLADLLRDVLVDEEAELAAWATAAAEGVPWTAATQHSVAQPPPPAQTAPAMEDDAAYDFYVVDVGSNGGGGPPAPTPSHVQSLRLASDGHLPVFEDGAVDDEDGWGDIVWDESGLDGIDAESDLDSEDADAVEHDYPDDETSESEHESVDS